MKVQKILLWDELQTQPGRQTAVIATYTFLDKPDKPNWTRIFVGGFEDRAAAWNWCQESGTKNGTFMSEQSGKVRRDIQLRQLSKVLRELAVTRPSNTSAWLL